MSCGDVGILSVGVSVSALYSDGYGVSGICITFSVSITVYSGLTNSSYKTNRLPGTKKSSVDKGESAKGFIYEKTQILKNMYDDWKLYLESVQWDADFSILHSMDEVVERAKPMVIKQTENKLILEEMIRTINKEMSGYKKYQNGKYIDNFLTLLSNCYQAIRDLTLTFCFGEMQITVRPEFSEDIVKLSGDLTEQYYAQPVMEKILIRKNISENILDTEMQIEKYSQKLLNLNSNIEKAKSEIENINHSISHRESSSNLYDTFLNEVYNDEEEYYTSVVNKLQKSIDGLDAKISNLNLEKNNLKGFSKKKTEEIILQQIEYVNEKKKEIDKIKAQFLDTRNELAEEKNKMDNAEDEIKYLNARKVIKNEEIQLNQEEINVITEIMDNGRLHLTQLKEEYTEIIHEFPEALIGQI